MSKSTPRCWVSLYLSTKSYVSKNGHVASMGFPVAPYVASKGILLNTAGLDDKCTSERKRYMKFLQNLDKEIISFKRWHAML